MCMPDLHDFKPNPKLAEILEATRKHMMTPEEVREQRISFAAGNLALHTGEDIGIVKERVRKVAEEIYGGSPKLYGCETCGTVFFRELRWCPHCKSYMTPVVIAIDKREKVT